MQQQMSLSAWLQRMLGGSLDTPTCTCQVIKDSAAHDKAAMGVDLNIFSSVRHLHHNSTMPLEMDRRGSATWQGGHLPL